MWRPNIVRVEESQITATGYIKRGVARAATSAISDGQNTNAIAKLNQNLGGIIGRAIIDDDYFEAVIVLGERTFDSARDCVRTIVNRNDNRDSGARRIIA
jgi:hypothetical protein